MKLKKLVRVLKKMAFKPYIYQMFRDQHGRDSEFSHPSFYLFMHLDWACIKGRVPVWVDQLDLVIEVKFRQWVRVKSKKKVKAYGFVIPLPIIKFWNIRNEKN
jgi:hypothetical protein